MQDVTTRRSGDKTLAWSHYEIMPLADGQVRSYLLRKAPGGTDAERDAHVQRIERAISSTYNLADLAHRPILLDMISATLGHSTETVATPADLYSQYVDTWLRIDAGKGAFRSLISRDDRLAFSIALAWLLHDRSEPGLHWSELQELVGAYFRLDEADDVDHLSADVRTCTFLRRDNDGLMSFAHFSFQEYFCARFLIEDHRHLLPRFETLLVEPSVTVAELADRSGAILNFAGDLLGCPISPRFWQYVRATLAEHPDLTARLAAGRGGGPGAQSLQLMLEMAEGDAHVLELHDVAEAYKEVYERLRQRVRRLRNAEGADTGLESLHTVLERGRLSVEAKSIGSVDGQHFG